MHIKESVGFVHAHVHVYIHVHVHVYIHVHVHVCMNGTDTLPRCNFPSFFTMPQPFTRAANGGSGRSHE